MPYKFLFSFSSDQRKGIFVLIVLIVLLQGAYWYWSTRAPKKSSVSAPEWLAMQAHIDSLKAVSVSQTPKIYPFNPNFITDYKGYQLGLSLEELDRLFAFRNENKYVNSAKEFQQVTLISDSLLQLISPYFKFPDWVNRPKAPSVYAKQGTSKSEAHVRTDINQASSEDLMKVYGIGPALSERILKQKAILGAFVSMDQLEDVWGLSPEVIQNIRKQFDVLHPPGVTKIKINELPTRELAKFPYFNYALSKEIVTYRSMNNGIKEVAELTKIKGFPLEKLDIIVLYLEF